jgi:sulfatase maturation enzyme AslB (radical SAM superfamily)
MSFEKKFCPSTWFHMRINNSGTYEYCRWKIHEESTRIDFVRNIKNQQPLDYFQNTLSPLREQFLSGTAPSGCRACHVMEQNGKISGRQKQLLKVGVRDPFAKTLASSPMKPEFDYSYAHRGHTRREVQDWQIDLGNYCNNACIYCNHESSSRLAAEFKQLGIINEIPPNSWCDDPELLDKFMQDLVSSTNTKYLHFLGGETLITPGFKTMLAALIEHNQSQHTTIGFTTNLNCWNQSVVDLLKQFQHVNLGMSIDTLTKVNDYVRWPNQEYLTKELLQRWIDLAQERNWLVQLRITPTCLTIRELDTIYEFAWEHNLSIESCNFLYDPAFMRIDVLPTEYKKQARDRLQSWVDRHLISGDTIINIRDPNQARTQIVQDAQSYINYIDSSQDESYRLPELVKYLKLLESNRKNSILDYIPEYEELFRSAGY